MKFFTLCFILISVNFNSAEGSPTQVSVQKIALEKVFEKLTFPASIQSRVESNIRSDGELIVKKSFVTLGEKVKKGQKLLELIQQDHTQSYLPRLIHSPVDGIVAQIYVKEGQFVARSQDLMLLNDPQKLYARLEIPQHFIDKLKIGQLATLENSQEDQLKISGIGTVADSLLATVTVECDFLSPQIQSTVMAGQIKLVHFAFQSQEKMYLPEEALYYNGDTIQVAHVEPAKKTILKKIITLKPSAGGKVEVLSGITPGDLIVVNSTKFLKDGEAVNFTLPKDTKPTQKEL